LALAGRASRQNSATAEAACKQRRIRPSIQSALAQWDKSLGLSENAAAGEREWAAGRAQAAAPVRMLPTTASALAEIDLRIRSCGHGQSGSYKHKPSSLRIRYICTPCVFGFDHDGFCAKLCAVGRVAGVGALHVWMVRSISFLWWPRLTGKRAFATLRVRVEIMGSIIIRPG
jgi:hypothetical protein